MRIGMKAPEKKEKQYLKYTATICMQPTIYLFRKVAKCSRSASVPEGVIQTLLGYAQDESMPIALTGPQFRQNQQMFTGQRDQRVTPASLATTSTPPLD
jgi:hypothetical protein